MILAIEPHQGDRYLNIWLGILTEAATVFVFASCHSQVGSNRVISSLS
jgi:hypothetical protein